MNILERLKEINEFGNKKHNMAVDLLNEITDTVQPLLFELLGYDKDESTKDCIIKIPSWNKEKQRYDNSSELPMHFRYSSYNDLGPGFYVGNGEYRNVSDLEGNLFWIKIKEITDWFNMHLPSFIEKNIKSRNQRFEKLENIAEKLRKK